MPCSQTDLSGSSCNQWTDLRLVNKAADYDGSNNDGRRDEEEDRALPHSVIVLLLNSLLVTRHLNFVVPGSCFHHDVAHFPLRRGNPRQSGRLSSTMVTMKSFCLLLIALPVSSGFSPVRLPASLHHGASSSVGLRAASKDCDVLVLGSGPAACSVASLLAIDHKVILADQNADRPWVPNYGVWEDEWRAIVNRYEQGGVKLGGGKEGQSVDRLWKVTDCFFGGSFDVPMDQRMRLDRPYCRVDRFALKDSLMTDSFEVVYANHISQAIMPNVFKPAGSLLHDKGGTTIQLKTKDSEDVTVRTKLIVDCTGHETRLVLKDSREPYRPPGFQIAYGVMVELDETDVADKSKAGPYDKEAMTLFDYRTDHFKTEQDELKATQAPTFMYVMPLEDNKVFFEETSLVARPAVSFQECKDRYLKRLEHFGMKVSKVIEEEYCYIPMGGALPAKDQRIIGFGGAAAMVHPSTGYHLCRCLMGATDLAVAIRKGLKENPADLDRVAASAYDSLWSPDNIRQRNFAVFGGEFLMKQNVVGLRGFFDGFFRLPLELWGGFLAGWPGLPNNDKHETWLARIWYGVTFLTKLPPGVALDMISSIISYSIAEGTPLLQSVTPFFGEPASYAASPNKDYVGDVAAKKEARLMIAESAAVEEVPVAFEDEESITSVPTTIAEKTPELV